MDILLAAKNPPVGGSAFGGVASWMVTLKKAFEARGHHCALSGPGLKGLKYFDVGLLSNIRATSAAARWCDRPVVVSHGVIPEEKPNWRFVTACTSEEVRTHWNVRGPVIRQPIDLAFWRDGDGSRRNLVFYSYRAPSVFGLDDLARRLRLDFVWLKDVDFDGARTALQGAALVAASGRAALEAMACGAPTMICDHRPYNGGPLVDMDMMRAMRANYSGRGGVSPDSIDLYQFARETMALQAPRAHVEAHHDSGVIAEEFLGFADQC